MKDLRENMSVIVVVTIIAVALVVVTAIVQFA